MTAGFLGLAGLAWTLLTVAAVLPARCPRQARGRKRDEEDRGGDQTLQTRRGEGGAAGGRTARHHCHGGEGLRAPERTHRALSRSRICGRFSPQGEDRDCARRRHGRESHRGGPSRRPNRGEWGWETLRVEHRIS